MVGYSLGIKDLKLFKTIVKNLNRDLKSDLKIKEFVRLKIGE